VKYPVYYFSGTSDLPFAYARLGKIHIAIELAQFLEERELAAVIAHEEAHLARQHWLSWMLASALNRVGFARLSAWLNHRAEFAADAYAVKHGHGLALQRTLAITTNPAMMDVADWTHPSANERRRRISELCDG